MHSPSNDPLARWSAPGQRQLRRPLERSLIGGVCAGLAEYLDVDVLAVRAAFLVLIAFSGVGVAIYPLTWALIPTEGARPPSWRERSRRWREALVLTLLAGVATAALRAIGVWLGAAVVLPLVLASTGAALILRQALDVEAPPPRDWRFAPWRRWPAGVLGIGLVAGAAVVVVHDAGILRATRHTIAYTLVALAAATLVLGPYLLGLARKLSLEREARIRTLERTEMAAHLHDSVLQTLALIQRRAEDPVQVVGLARRQERELRDWLLERERASDVPATLRAAVQRLAAEVETDHGVRVEAVVVGDCPLDEPLPAVLAAAREALVNASKFAEAQQIDIYVEADDAGVEVFVRDRGRGFDPEQVPPDRQGIRRSIHERMARHGGHASVRSAPEEGTEVKLTIGRGRS